MPVALNGFGTAYRGKTKTDKDGFSVTTVFVVAAFFPILPLGSYAIRPVSTARNVAFFFHEQEFETRRVPFNWKQILLVYLKWYLGLILYIALASLWGR